MDVPRTGARPRTRRVVLLAIAVAGLTVITAGMRWLKDRVPSVPRAQLWIGTVQRGPLTLEIRGQGTLVPTDFRWASAPVSARIDKVLVQAGAQVEPATVLIELINPDAELAALEADREVAAAESELARLGAQLDGTRLAQESVVASLGADVVMAKRRSTIDAAMAHKGVISDLESLESTDRAGQLVGRVEFERKRLAALRRGNAAQLDAQRAQVERLRALAELRHRQLDALHVRAGQAGVVQQVAVEIGQSVVAGAPLARIVVPDHLQARLRIPESSTEDLALGLSATIDTRSGVVAGEVVRIDPAAQNGVEGVIQLARTGDVLHIARPAIGEAHQTAALFKLDGAGEARRVAVRFGRAALKDIEITGGLSAGDQVVLSDMSKWDGNDRLGIE